MKLSTTRNRNEKVLFFLIFLPSLGYAGRPQLGFTSQSVFNDTGNKSIPFSASVGTTTAVNFYSGQDYDRELFIQNPSSSYKLYIATYPLTSTTSGPRLLLRASQDMWIDNSSDWYGLFESAAGSGTIEILGSVERHNRDVK